MHYLSDVIGAWAAGITWPGLTTTAFELTRRAAGQPVTGPVTEAWNPRPALISPRPAGAHHG